MNNMVTHDEVKRRIDRGESGHAQGKIDGQLVSIYTDGPIKTFIGSIMINDMKEVRGRFIDGIVAGTITDYTPGTFTKQEFLERADYHRYRKRPPEHGDEERAKKIEEFAKTL